MKVFVDENGKWHPLAEYAENQIATDCICCGKIIYLGHNYSALVPRLCDQCIDAIKWAKEIKRLCAEAERRSDDG